MGGGRDCVLVVEDNAELRQAYHRVLSEFCAVSTAASGADAVETITDDTDVVVLDRPLPAVTVDTLVSELKNRHHDCYVAMVTGVAPPFDISRLGVDDYLVRPLTIEQLRDTVDRLFSLAEYDAAYRTLSQKRVEKSVRVREQASTELRHSPEIDRLSTEIERLETEIERLEAEIDEQVETLGGMRPGD
ncbi:response regulator [Haloarcula sp. S1CR25-12]|uniref:Response regulator n=1 Tax=Haloarcula saliterrae TaxID=2950534 RepID=A0ABU2FBE7_9EURY|nr:response regulator [Haloarcula sp. S1CR25-12]MDS0259579.1 response regulator [Haloarcula sp. S1CR25-12]